MRSVSSSCVGLDGTVNPMGLPTSYHFEFGVTPSYGQSTTQQDAGSGLMPVSVSATIGNLAPSGSYHWRLVAVSSAGTASTADSTFITPVDMAFPLAVGTTWTYAYENDNGLCGIQRSRGVHVWQV